MQNKTKTVAAVLRAALAASVLAALGGCAGTIKQDMRVQGDVSRVNGVSGVAARMSPEATRQQADNQQFNREELAGFLRRRLESKGLVAATAAHQVEIVVTDIRVRSAVAAVLFGFMAGDDHVNGVVRVTDASGKPLRSFEVKANYAFGGIGGGQDSVRLNWLYEKFSELASTELEKLIATPQAGVVSPVAAAAPAARPAAASPVVVPDVASLPSTGAIDDVDVVPVGPKGREGYRQWLTWKPPRAFVVADDRQWNYARGTNPTDPTLPRDPVARALQICQNMGRIGCTLYAVDDRVVYAAPARSR